MRNTLVDSALGDVTQINLPIGQTTPFPGAFTTLAASSASVGQLTIAGQGVLTSLNPSVAVTATTNNFTAAVPLTAAVNVVVTALDATAPNPVALPSIGAALGSNVGSESFKVVVFNQTTHTVAVWPQAADAIDVATAGTAVLLDAGKRAEFFAAGLVATTTSTTGQWISAQLGVTSV